MITIHGPELAQETRAAELLREMILTWYPQAEADPETRIWLLSSVQCYGRTTQDVDVLLLATFGPRAPMVTVPGVEQSARLRTLACTFEVKTHLPDAVHFAGQRVLVDYGTSKKDVTQQASDQMFALRNYLVQRIGKAPFSVDFIWLRGVPTAQLPKPPHNVLGCDSTWVDVLRCIRDSRLGPSLCDGELWSGKPDVLERAAEELSRGLEATRLDRQRIERLTSRLLAGQRYAREMGTKTLVFRGRGGTGKTANLLRLAHDLYQDQGARILLLTYNNALVADIQRLLVLMSIPSASISRSIKTQTVHSFVFALHSALVGNETMPQGTIEERFTRAKAEILEYLAITTQEDRAQIIGDPSGTFNWDYVLIDESQDWFEDERDILYQLFSSQRVVLADGVDQLTRRATRADWLSTLPASRRQVVPLKRTLRLKRNLCEFVLLMGRELGLGELNIEPVEEQAGGLVTIYVGDYLSERATHDDVVNLTVEDGNKPVDTLFVVSDRHVSRTVSSGRSSRAAETFASWGYEVWDGVDLATRKTFPTSVDQLRVVQYESCRGLEAWTTVCLGADHFYERKLNEGRRLATASPGELFTDPEQRARDYAGQWMLIPFTRSIDWLVIEVSSRESVLGQMLQRVTSSMGEPTEWL
jgi:hypothetical protein